MEIKEVGNKVKQMASGKGLWVVAGIFVVLFLISLISQSGGTAEEEENVSLQGAYASYPDVVTNADVVISSLQNSIDYQTEELTGFTQGHFENTNSLIEDGMLAQAQLTTATHDDIMQGVSDLLTQGNSNTEKLGNQISNTQSSLSEQMGNMGSSLSNQIGGMGSSILSSMDSQYNSLNNAISSVSSQVGKVATDVNIYRDEVNRANTNLSNAIKDIGTNVNNIQSDTSSILINQLNNSEKYKATQEELNTMKNTLYDIQSQNEQISKDVISQGDKLSYEIYQSQKQEEGKKATITATDVTPKNTVSKTYVQDTINKILAGGKNLGNGNTQTKKEIETVIVK